MDFVFDGLVAGDEGRYGSDPGSRVGCVGSNENLRTGDHKGGVICPSIVLTDNRCK